jgi:hypothetical protein
MCANRSSAHSPRGYWYASLWGSLSRHDTLRQSGSLVEFGTLRLCGFAPHARYTQMGRLARRTAWAGTLISPGSLLYIDTH